MLKQERSSRRGVVRAETRVAVLNAHLNAQLNAQVDATTMRLDAMVVALGQDFVKRLFKTAPAQFVRTSLCTQCETTKNVMRPELNELDLTHPLKPFEAALQPLAHNAIQALGLSVYGGFGRDTHQQRRCIR